MGYFKKKPVVIEAIQFNGELTSIEAFGIPEISQELGSDTCQIPTLEGEMTARKGDWIIKGVKGEFYPCRSDIFEATYEATPSPAVAHGDVSALKLTRSIETWEKCDPSAMSKQSEAAIMYALKDARADILKLHAAINKAEGNHGL